MTRTCGGCKQDRAETLFGRPEDPCAYCMAGHVEEDAVPDDGSPDPVDPTKTRTAPLPQGAANATRELANRTLSRKHLLPFVLRFNPKYDAGWVHKDICQRLEKFSQDVADKKSPRLMLFMPPRHGKSTLSSIAFPAWHLGNYPDHEVISCSYSGSLAMKFSRKVRNMLRDVSYSSVFPKCELDPDSQGAEEWLTTTGGGYVAAGVGGGITGKGAHCAYFACGIATPHGTKSISAIKVGDKVLGYDHESRTTVWTTVRAVSTQHKPNDFVRVGDAILTPDHRVWTEENGYVEVRTLLDGVPEKREGAQALPEAPQPGREDLLLDSLCQRENKYHGMRLREPQSGAREHLQSVLSEGETVTAYLSAVSYTVHPDRRGNKEVDRQGAYGNVLLSRMLQQESCSAAAGGAGQGSVQQLREAHPQEILQPQVLSDPHGALPSVFRGMEQGTEGSESPGPRDLRPLRSGAPENGSAPHQSRGNGPRSTELDPSMRAVSSPLSSANLGVCADDLAGLLPEPGEGSVRVVDIQTGTENFFLCGILTHNCLIIDDPVKNREDAESPNVKESVQDWYTSTAYTRLAPGGGILLIMTRWADDDLAGWLLSEMKDGGEEWEVVKYPAIAEEDELYRDKGDPLHPERYDLAALKRIERAVGPRDWPSLFQQNPVPDTGAYFNTGMIHYYDPKERDDKALRFYSAWDLAIGKDDRNDYTVGVTVGIDRLDNIYVVDVARGKWDGSAIVENILDSYQLWRPAMVGIEKGHIEMAIGPFLQKRVAERKLYEAYFHDLKTGRRDKEARSRAIQGRMQQGKVFFPKGASFTGPLVAELLRFPSGEHDDQVDALAWIGLMMAEFSTVPGFTKPKEASWRDRLDSIGVQKRSRTAMSA